MRFAYAGIKILQRRIDDFKFTRLQATPKGRLLLNRLTAELLV